MQRFKNILCVVASNFTNEVALERAATLANNNQASLTVVTVIDEIPPDTTLLDRTLFPENKAKIVEESRKELQELVAPWKSHVDIQTKVLTGISFIEIVREVLRCKRDLVIKASDNDKFLDRLFGSDDMHLLRKCPCPVWLDNSKSPKAYSRILAAVDVSDYYPSEELNTRHRLNLQVLEIASSLALSEFAELHILVAYIGEVKDRRRKSLDTLMDEAFSKLRQSSLEHLNPKTHLLEGSPRKEIPAFANKIEADIAVMGTVARVGIPGFFMGNTAETILNQISCSVLAIKPFGFVTPVTIEN